MSSTGTWAGAWNGAWFGGDASIPDGSMSGISMLTLTAVGTLTAADNLDRSSYYGSGKAADDDSLVMQVIEKWEFIDQARRSPILDGQDPNAEEVGNREDTVKTVDDRFE